MQKKSVTYGGAMGMKVAFCNAMSVDLPQAKKMIWVSGQPAFDENEQFVGKGDIKAQTEQCLKNIGKYLNDFFSG